MRPDESFVCQPIRSLQTMLRVLAEYDGSYQTVIPDGIYGNQTMNAVSVFQRHHGIPATGMTDQFTWEAIVEAYTPALVHVTAAQPVEIILSNGETIRRGDESPYLFVAQALLQVLSDRYGSIGTPSHSGILDDQTADSLSSFQAICGMPMTGNLDKVTWKHLALHYPLAANLGKGQTQAEGKRKNR